MKDSIKIGIVLDHPIVPIWIYQVIKKLIESDFAEIKLIAYTNKTTENQHDIPFFYSLHEKFERLILGKRISFDKTKSISEILQSLPILTFSSDIEAAFDEINNYKLDIIINFSSLEIAHSNISSTRWGVWSCAIENQGIFEPKTKVYWKVAQKSPVINVTIYKSNRYSYNSKSAIHTSFISTNFKSTLINLDQAFDLFSQIIPRLIKNIYLFDDKYINNQLEKYSKINDKDKPSSTQLPSNSLALLNLLISVLRLIKGRLTYFKKWRWFLMYSPHPYSFPIDISKYTSLIPPKDCFWADPFVISLNDKEILFIEEFPYIRNKGHITLLELDHSGKIVNKEKIIDQPYHMSYPFVFECDKQYYMVPETSANRTIELYKSDEFPGKWRLVMNLMENVNAKDSTLFYFNQKWWLFTAINESSASSDHVELFLFFSDDLMTANWKPHPQNPIVTDIRTARPAGRIFTQGDKIFRPSQDCSVRYGRALNILQIVTLKETAYEEILVSKSEVDSNSKLRGIHTFNSDGKSSIIDIYKL